VRIGDRNHLLDRRMVARAPESCSVDLDTFAVSRELVVAAMHFADKLGKGFRGPLTYSDCIQPIELPYQ